MSDLEEALIRAMDALIKEGGNPEHIWHPEYVGTGENSHARWCQHHNQYHGILHVCPFYPETLKDYLVAEGSRFARNVRDPEWIAKNRAAEAANE